jgi:hypothetical protein
MSVKERSEHADRSMNCGMCVKGLELAEPEFVIDSSRKVGRMRLSRRVPTILAVKTDNWSDWR